MQAFAFKFATGLKTAMVSNNKLWIIIYIGLCLPFIYLGNELNTVLAIISKTAPICVLAYIAHSTLTTNLSRSISTALIFSACGDAILETNYSWSFPLGMAAFLIAQLIYASQLWKNKSKTISRAPVILLGFFAFGMLYLLSPATGNLMPAIVIYLAAICAMVAAAYLYNGSTFVKIGALSFLVSDSCIAVNKFLYPLDNASLIIMLTYYLAQLLLCLGLTIDHSKATPQANKT